MGHVLFISIPMGEDEEELPAKYAVCSTCEGRGTHVNPAIDGNGILAEEFHEDPDFAESYFSGLYDVRCYGCEGACVTLVVDREKCDPETLNRYDAWVREERAYQALCEAERRAGA